MSERSGMRRNLEAGEVRDVGALEPRELTVPPEPGPSAACAPQEDPADEVAARERPDASRAALIGLIVALSAGLVAAPLWAYERLDSLMATPFLLGGLGLLLCLTSVLLWRARRFDRWVTFALATALAAVGAAHYEEGVLKPHLVQTGSVAPVDETLARAAQTAHHGHLVFGDPHSYFPFSSVVITTISEVTGLSRTTSALVGGLALAVLAIAVAIVVIQRLWVRGPSRRAAILAFLAFAATLIPVLVARGELSYRFTGPLLVAAAIALRWCSREERWQTVVIDLVLITAAVTDSSIAAAMAISYFGCSALARRRLPSFGVVIPIAWMVFAAGPYLATLRFYGGSVLQGLDAFLDAIGRGRLVSIVPGTHASLPSSQVLVVASVGVIAALAMSAWAVILSARAVVRAWRRGVEVDPRLVGALALVPGLILVPLVWVGSYVAPQTSSSDVRDIALLLVTLFFAFGVSAAFGLARPSSRRRLTLVACVAVGVTAVVQLPQWYPISRRDPVNAVEDPRVSPGQAEALGRFVVARGLSARLVADYSTCIRLLPILNSASSSCVVNDPRTLATRDLGLIAFDRHGLALPSTNQPPAFYRVVRRLASRGARVYDSGAIAAISR